MNDCFRCPVEKQCHYPFKVCDCVGQRKFWTLAQRQAYEADVEKQRAKMPVIARVDYEAITGRAISKLIDEQD